MKTTTNRSQNKRLDALVADRFGMTRSRAQALIMEGRVRVDGEPLIKSGALVPSEATLELESAPKFVGRGGLKLERALDEFGWSVEGMRCLDVGASTGGFTDCLLQRGASHVTAVDVGYGQMAWQLRNDPRVTVVERTNFRYAKPSEIGAPFDFICADVSFISLALLSAQFASALKPGVARPATRAPGRIVALIKPQFEAGPEANKRGVVRDPAVQAGVIRSVIEAFAANGLISERLTYSPIAGPAGNLEFLLGAVFQSNVASGLQPNVASGRSPLTRQPNVASGRSPLTRQAKLAALDIDAVVRQAHELVKRA